MRLNVRGALAALALGAALATPASAQGKPTIAIMPSQYFSATAESASNFTDGLARQFEQQGYTVIPADRVQAAYQQMGLSPSQHYADRVAIKLGKQVGADLIAYPRLLAVGIPINDPAIKTTDLLQPAAVAHLRVLNTHSRAPIFFRQIAHEFTTDAPQVASSFNLPEPIATATASEVTTMYFQRVAGSRQEFRR
jgi:hypothetical protein